MFAILYALGMFVADLFKSRSRLEAENLFLRHQLNIALRRAVPSIAILRLLIGALRDYFKSRRQLQAEALVLRHQINILRRQVPGRVRPTASDRAIFVWLYRIFADVGNAIVIVRPETIVR